MVKVAPSWILFGLASLSTRERGTIFYPPGVASAAWPYQGVAQWHHMSDILSVPCFEARRQIPRRAFLLGVTTIDDNFQGLHQRAGAQKFSAKEIRPRTDRPFYLPNPLKGRRFSDEKAWVYSMSHRCNISPSSYFSQSLRTQFSHSLNKEIYLDFV